MKAYIINLEKSKDRRKKMLVELQKCNLDFEIFNAVDGRQLTESDFTQICDMKTVNKYPKWLNPGMIGASISHINCLKKISESNNSFALILEDDVTLSENLSEILREIVKIINENEVILLNYMSFSELNLSDHKSVLLTKDHKLYYPINFKNVTSAAGYVISNKAARTMSKKLLPVKSSPDSWMKFYNEGLFDSIRFVYPMPVKVVGAKSMVQMTNQNALRGNITNLIDKYKIPPFYQILKSLRMRSINSRSKVRIVNERSKLFVK